MTGLGQTSDPQELIPGVPAYVYQAELQLRLYGEVLLEAAAGDTAAAAIGRARDLAPSGPGIWGELASDAGSFLSGAGHFLKTGTFRRANPSARPSGLS